MRTGLVEPISFESVNSEILGLISPTWLSEGVKNLILLEQQRPFQTEASYLGDNCAPYLEELCHDTDVHMHYDHNFHFTETQVAIFPELNNLQATGHKALFKLRMENYNYDWD